MSTLLDDGTNLPGLGDVVTWFNDPSNWTGSNGLLQHIGEHVAYTAVLVTAAAALALPCGIVVGHTGRGSLVVAGVTNALRAVPSLGLLILLIVELSPHIKTRDGLPPLLQAGSVPYFIPVCIVLIALAIPPILSSTFAGIQAIDPATRDAARGTGMTALQTVANVEVPCALPLILSGLRSATLQVIASLTVAAYAPLVGGLGRLITDGDQNLTDTRYGYPAMVAAGITVTALALAADALFDLTQLFVVSPGVSGRYRHSASTARSTPTHHSHLQLDHTRHGHGVSP